MIPLLRTVPPAALLLLAACGSDEAGSSPATERPPAPVSAASIEVRPITQRRTFSGTLEASAEVTVAPRITGQLERLTVDIGDTVTNGQTIALLQDDEWRQAVTQAEAELSVARANHAEAEAADAIARRALERAEALHSDGVTSQAELDTQRTAALAASSRIAVTLANIERAEAALETARLRLSETRVVARWTEDAPRTENEAGTTDAPGAPGGSESTAIDDAAAPSDAPSGGSRLVAQRFVDEGALASAGAPLVTIVDLEPVVAVVFVPERDYSGLAVGQPASLVTDAYAGRTFDARVARIAPVFSRATRQVRVELSVPNPDLVLKPGMFVRATLEIDSRDAAVCVPYAALTKRNDTYGVFALDKSGVAHWRAVTPGIREGDFVELAGVAPDAPESSGRVVTLGQELLDDGSPVTVIEDGAE